MGIDLEKLKKDMGEASRITGTAARAIAKQFLDANREIVAEYGKMGAKWALPIIGQVALAVGSFKLMGAAINATREQLREMVAIADKSQNLGVSPAFLQSWNAVSRQLKIGTEDLEGALAHAFSATKDKAPVDLGLWDTGKDRITEVERALRIYNETVAKAAGQKLEGLVLFREADSQEAKIQAVLKAMIQLEQIGQRAAALDIGEKMFGTAFVDRIRQGRTSAENMLDTMRKMQESDSGIYSSALVSRAKQVDDQLRLSHERLSQALKPSFDDLASVMLTIKNTWADTVGLIGQAVELANKFGILGSEASRLKTQRDELDDAIKNGNQIRLFGFNTGVRLPADTITLEDNKRKRSEIQAQIDDLERQPNSYPRIEQARGAGPAPTLKPTGSDTDKFDTSADAIEKRTAALMAEAGAVDLGTAARERAKITAQLETVAKQANVAAGLGENVVTQQQRDRINEVAAAYSRAALEIDKARVASSIKFGQQTALLSPEDVAIAAQLKGIYPDVATALGSVEAQAMRSNEALRGISSTISSNLTTGLADMLNGTKSVSQGFADMSRVIIRALEEALIKMLIVAPVMRGLQGMLGFSEGGFIGPVKPAGYAGGGLIQGPGTGTSDSILARVSNREFIVNADATAKHRDVLEAINSGSIPAFANGGLVSAAPIPTASGSINTNAPVTTIAPVIQVSVQGSAGSTPEQHAAMGETIAKSVGPAVREMIVKEMRTQTRPGGLLSRR
jgi:hypothetical protein